MGVGRYKVVLIVSQVDVITLEAPEDVFDQADLVVGSAVLDNDLG